MQKKTRNYYLHFFFGFLSFEHFEKFSNLITNNSNVLPNDVLLYRISQSFYDILCEIAIGFEQILSKMRIFFSA